jgi:drug/metabolite transporter (DMT)-like permease
MAVAILLMILLNMPLHFPAGIFIYLAFIIGAVCGPILNKQLIFKILAKMKLSLFILSSQISTVIIFVVGVILFNESLTLLKLIGAILVVLGAVFLQKQRSFDKGPYLTP